MFAAAQGLDTPAGHNRDAREPPLRRRACWAGLTPAWTAHLRASASCHLGEACPGPDRASTRPARELALPPASRRRAHQWPCHDASTAGQSPAGRLSRPLYNEARVGPTMAPPHGIRPPPTERIAAWSTRRLRRCRAPRRLRQHTPLRANRKTHGVRRQLPAHRAVGTRWPCLLRYPPSSPLPKPAFKQGVFADTRWRRQSTLPVNVPPMHVFLEAQSPSVD